MAFSSITFLFLFLPLVLSAYFFIGRKYQNLFLLLASLLFYVWGEKKYVFIIIVYSIANYFFGRYIDKYHQLNTPRGFHRAKLIFIVALCFNLGLLIYFKYTNFLVNNFSSLIEAGTGFTMAAIKQIYLPLGLSFITFRALSYIIDVYRKDVKSSTSLIDFTMYTALFPQLIAGPIIRYRDICRQITERSTNIRMISSGIKRFIIGLGKKVLIANTLASFVDQLFDMPPDTLSTTMAWFGVVCYALQIYFDFSGYSDMAIGLAKVFGFDFLENFNYPYVARSIRDFWRRWHISLSMWFRDYLYISLGGNRGKRTSIYSNLLIVFLLCGLWHGANWTFLIWGLWHGLFIMLEHTKWGKWLDSTADPVKYSYTIMVVLIGWVFFRAETVSFAIDYLKVMFGFSANHSMSMMSVNIKTILAFVLGVIGSTPLLRHLLNYKNQYLPEGDRSRLVLNMCVESVMGTYYLLQFLTCVVFLSGDTFNPFIYFKF